LVLAAPGEDFGYSDNGRIPQTPGNGQPAVLLVRRTFLRMCGAGLAADQVPPAAWALEAKDQPEIWGRTVLPQPFDREPFREVRLPAWVRESAGVGYTLSGQDLPVNRAADTLETRVPRLDIHCMVVAELG
jgi:hypothetical protein